jgi:hypothetical protein
VLLGGCGRGEPPKGDFNLRLEAVERQVALLQASGVGASFRPYTALTGGGTGALDKTDGATLSLGDVAFVALNSDATYGTVLFTYVYHDYSGAVSESAPWAIKPDTNPNANYAWQLSSASTAPPVVVTSSPYTLSAAEARTGFVQMTVTGEVDLPAAATAGFGTMVCFYARDAEVITLDPNGSEKIVLEGVAQGAGVTITSDGAAGDFTCLVAVTDTDGSGTDGWVQMGYGKTSWNTGS